MFAGGLIPISTLFLLSFTVVFSPFCVVFTLHLLCAVFCYFSVALSVVGMRRLYIGVFPTQRWELRRLQLHRVGSAVRGGGSGVDFARP